MVCTGLGRIKRGFESYILDLAAMLQESTPPIQFQVLAGKKIEQVSFQQEAISHIHRHHSIWRWLRLHANTAFAREQDFFFLGMIPQLFKNKAALYYLGEYRLYCHLYRFRKWFGLQYRLCLYTGGQAIPGLFDNRYDYVHHITQVYYQQALKNGIPENKQRILPHVVNHEFEQDATLIESIQKKAKGKKIILSVGTIDTKVKRMHLIPAMLQGMEDDFFVVICGNRTRETPEIEKQLIAVFGEQGYLLVQVDRKLLGSYYAAADAFVLCSPKESFGMALVEAMYHQLPILVHDFEEAHYVTQENATYINMDSIEQVQRWIKENWYHQKIEKSVAAQSFAMDSYSRSALANKYTSMFQNMLQ